MGHNSTFGVSTEAGTHCRRSPTLHSCIPPRLQPPFSVWTDDMPWWAQSVQIFNFLHGARASEEQLVWGLTDVIWHAESLQPSVYMAL